ncbi:hypothetical protein PVAP13_3KG126241 [Panicum virgatum]|uniref:Uncharacterized protein n=1 Tax=Panicum virgatum TaxID=38727 RepID=A0A8T0UZ70_PANVG|nr:hypothetical protein PVAP13_3KG126241 [Panicum virgatum]
MSSPALPPSRTCHARSSVQARRGDNGAARAPAVGGRHERQREQDGHEPHRHQQQRQRRRRQRGQHQRQEHQQRGQAEEQRRQPRREVPLPGRRRRPALRLLQLPAAAHSASARTGTRPPPLRHHARRQPTLGDRVGHLTPCRRLQLFKNGAQLGLGVMHTHL